MTATFADTAYWIALVVPTDAHHQRAVAANSGIAAVVTTRFVLAELGVAPARVALRPMFLAILDQIEADPAIRIVAADDPSFREGVDLFRARPDKDWSLTDCISFVVKQREGITEALTADHHFEQAGFVALLK
jgi:predicted nucleic acid-binding protein